MALTRVSPALFQVSNNITSVTVGGSANTISLTFDSNGVITGASNNALSVANTLITGNIVSSQITSVANTQISGNIASSQITSNPTLYGNVSVTGVIGVGGATPSTSGSGITFPATQSASSNANTLDDYEEGTWSAVVTAESGSITTYAIDSANYTKTGNTVFVYVRFTVNNKGTGSNFIVSGLPFTSAAQLLGNWAETNLLGLTGFMFTAGTGATSFTSRSTAGWGLECLANGSYTVQVTYRV